MKRCPECRRDYYDDTLLYCLEDGTALVQGAVPSPDEPATAILSEPGAVATGFPASESPTKDQIVPRGVEAGPQNPGDLAEKPRFSANRAAKPLAVFSVVVVILILGFFSYRYFSPTKQIESIAVMPLVNESGNQDLEYLSDGMTETLITDLSEIPSILVKSRSSVFRYKAKDISPSTAARELNVQAILSGRVTQRGDQLNVYVELINASTENVIWKANYSRQLTNLLALQKDIARDVSNNMKARLSNDPKQQFSHNGTDNDQAYQLYLRGRYLFYRRRQDDMDKAAELYRQAVEADPRYALAYSGLADIYALTGTPRDSMPKAREAALKAVSLDSRLADAHNSLGLIAAIYDYDFSAAEREFQRSLELDPNNATAHFYYGSLYAHLRRFDESLAELRLALELEPFSVVINRAYGEKLTAAGQYDQALVQLEKTVELDPTNSFSHLALSDVNDLKGDKARSVDEFVKFVEGTGNMQLAGQLRESFAHQGWKGFLRGIVTGHPNIVLAPYYAALGDKDRAFEELNKAYERRDYYVVLVREDPRLNPLHEDPRFAELVRRIGLPN